VRRATRHIVTGAPGTGKTAVLAMMPSDVVVVREPAREVLAEQRAAARPVRNQGDEQRFVDLLLRRSIEKFEAALRLDATVVFDRGIPDCIAYAAYLGADMRPSIDAADTYRYDAPVLLLTPWEAIYRTDDERTMTFEDVVAFDRALRGAYRTAGYEVVQIPQAPTNDRAAFVLGMIRP
jgi:predicted ATPase